VERVQVEHRKPQVNFSIISSEKLSQARDKLGGKSKSKKDGKTGRETGILSSGHQHGTGWRKKKSVLPTHKLSESCSLVLWERDKGGVSGGGCAKKKMVP